MEINNLGKPSPISAMGIYQKRLKKICESILALGDNPYMGTEPGYRVLKRQRYKVLILEKDLIFYKIKEEEKEVVIYAVVDQRQDYLSIVRGL